MVPHMVAGIEGQFAETGVQLPEWYKQLPKQHECYAWHEEKPASCAPKLGHSEKTVQVTTAASTATTRPTTWRPAGRACWSRARTGCT